MGEPPMPSTPRSTTSSTSSTIFSSSPSSPPGPLLPVPVSLIQPSQKKRKKPTKFFRKFRNIFRAFPVFTPVCKLPALPNGLIGGAPGTMITGNRVTGTLYGYRKGKVTLCVQENPRCFPTIVVELAMQTSFLQKEMNLGMVRIALECEKRPEKDKNYKLIQEPVWAMYCNGKKTGFCFKREASEEDLMIMELLKAVSMGAGVLPGNSETEGTDGELAYMRAHFEHVVGSKDSETLYMFSPLGNNGPDLTIFFVRV